MTGPAPEYMSKTRGGKEKNEKRKMKRPGMVWEASFAKTGYARRPSPKEMT